MSMLDDVLAQLGDRGVAEIGRCTGLAPVQASRAVEGALPAPGQDPSGAGDAHPARLIAAGATR